MSAHPHPASVRPIRFTPRPLPTNPSRLHHASLQATLMPRCPTQNSTYTMYILIRIAIPCTCVRTRTSARTCASTRASTRTSTLAFIHTRPSTCTCARPHTHAHAHPPPHGHAHADAPAESPSRNGFQAVLEEEELSVVWTVTSGFNVDCCSYQVTIINFDGAPVLLSKYSSPNPPTESVQDYIIPNPAPTTGNPVCDQSSGRRGECELQFKAGETSPLLSPCTRPVPPPPHSPPHCHTTALPHNHTATQPRRHAATLPRCHTATPPHRHTTQHPHLWHTSHIPRHTPRLLTPRWALCSVWRGLHN